MGRPTRSPSTQWTSRACGRGARRSPPRPSRARTRSLLRLRQVSSRRPRTETSITLSWQASTDAGGVAGYRVYRDGALLGIDGLDLVHGHRTDLREELHVRRRGADASGNHSSRPATIVSTTAGSDSTPPRSELVRGRRLDCDERVGELERRLGQRRGRRLLALRRRFVDRDDEPDYVLGARPTNVWEVLARRPDRRSRRQLPASSSPRCSCLASVFTEKFGKHSAASIEHASGPTRSPDESCGYRSQS